MSCASRFHDLLPASRRMTRQQSNDRATSLFTIASLMNCMLGVSARVSHSLGIGSRRHVDCEWSPNDTVTLQSLSQIVSAVLSMERHDRDYSSLSDIGSTVMGDASPLDLERRLNCHSLTKQ